MATGEHTLSGKAKAVLLLHALLVFYSLSSICAKLAAGQEFLSLGFIGLYGGMVVVLFAYALGWQQVIKRLPLTFAYANKAVTVVWGIIWGVLFFGEAVSPLKLVGAAIVLAGVVLFATSEDYSDEERELAAAAGADSADAPEEVGK